MPNILICGTPGTGKSTIIQYLRNVVPQMNYVNLGKFAIDNNCADEFDETLDTHVINEDKLLGLVKPILENNNNIIEYHHADVLPNEMIHAVFVCRSDNTKLYDRLAARGYSQIKINNNLEAEIFRLILDEAIEHFGSDKVHELSSNDVHEIESNVQLISDRINRLQ
ncbi:FAP7, partial [Fragariocoptes setiger]